MKLYFRELGSGEPLVILHGLYGSSDNWISIGRALSSMYRVFLVDQRNHGQSPHAPTHSYEDLADDLLSFFNDRGIEPATLIGHSMGGKAAMQFASSNSNRLKRLVVVDILPTDHRTLAGKEIDIEREHRQILSALLELPVSTATSREELDQMLSHRVKSTAVRQFLLKSVKRNGDGTFQWQLNTQVLYNSIDSIVGAVAPVANSTKVETPTLFLKGETSHYIYPEGELALKDYFCNYRVVTIPNAGHWVHAENPTALLAEVVKFIGEASGQQTQYSL